MANKQDPFGREAELLTFADAARVLGVSTRTIFRAVELGELRAVPAIGAKRGRRILRSDLERRIAEAAKAAEAANREGDE